MRLSSSSSSSIPPAPPPSPFPSTPTSSPSWPWLLLLLGLLLAFLLAAFLVLLVKINDLNDRKSTTEELARTRYESEMKELHEIKVKIDYAQSLYQDDIKRIILREVK